MLKHCGGSCRTCNLSHTEPVWKGPDWQLYETASIYNDKVTSLDLLKKGGLFVLFEGGAVIHF
jgi:hypothetical protein